MLEGILNNTNYDFLHCLRNIDENNEEHFSINDSPYSDCNISCNYIDESSYNIRFGNCKKLSIMSINIQSLPSKFSEFLEMIAFMSSSSCNPDIICVQETWKIMDPELYCLPGYHCPMFKLRENKQGGGVAIYVKDVVSYSIIDKYSTTIDKVVDCLFIEIRTVCKKKFIIGNFYRTNTKYTSFSEKIQFETFMEFLNNVLADINVSNVPTYISGDFNINVLN
jgi:exonuclease III